MKIDKNARDEFNFELLSFLKSSVTPFHTVDFIRSFLLKKSFVELKEDSIWEINSGCNYFVIREDSAIVVFTVPPGQSSNLNVGNINEFKVVAAHNDAPCLKVKPLPEIKDSSILRAGVEVYGGPILSTWFDRDLSLAGKVVYKCKKDGSLKKSLINFKKPVAFLPNLAIHLNPQINENRTINKQTELSPVLCSLKQLKDDKASLVDTLIHELSSNYGLKEIDNILSFDLSFYDTQAPSIIGLEKEFLVGSHLDDLLGCYMGVKSIVDSLEKTGSSSNSINFFIAYDNEEIGSGSNVGAYGNFLGDTLRRIVKDPQELLRIVSRSLVISSDNAHAVHPSYKEAYEPNHTPKLNSGPVLKVNACKRYATSVESGAIFKVLCLNAGVKVQEYVNRTDKRCGSTIGPIQSQQLGVEVVDVGLAMWGMHSIREISGIDDVLDGYKVFIEFYNNPIPSII